MASIVQLMPGQIKEVELSSEGEENNENGNIEDNQNSKHIIQIIDSNKNLIEGLGQQGIHQLKQLASLKSLNVNQASTNNLSNDNYSPPESQSRRNGPSIYKSPIINYKPVEMTSLTQNNSKMSRPKLNVVNLEMNLGEKEERFGTKMSMDDTPGFIN